MLKPSLNLAARLRRKRPIILANIAPTQAQTDDLARLYLKIVQAWRAVLPAVIAEYERTIAQMQTDSAATTGGTIDGLAAQIQRLVILLTPDLRRWAVNVENVHRGKWVRSVLSATDIDLDTILSPGDMNETVEAAIEWNTALIRDVAEQTRKRVADAVFSGFQRRAAARDIAKEIREATGLARARSLRIAADQSVKLGARLNQARQEQAGLTHFKWRHSGKLHPRSWHKARDGRVFSWENSGIPADDMPGVPPFCGCVAQGILLPESSDGISSYGLRTT